VSPRATPARLLASTAVLLAAAAGALALAASVGTTSFGDLAVSEETRRFVVREIRLPRALFAALVGGALSVSGAAFQALLRNPLASPYILGVSGGGSLGAVLAIVAGLPALAPGVPVLPLTAFGGCLAAIALIHAAARRRGHLLAQDLLLAGVVANSFFLAALSVLQFLATPHQAAQILHWTLGAVRTERVPVAAASLLVAAGLLLLLRDGVALNLLSVGDETAALLGVDVEAVRRRAFVAASLLTGTAVAVSGPIGFVGLFVPHGVRRVLGPDHRVLLPASFLAGAAFLVLADTAARTAFGATELPVGVLTAVVGAPAFVVLLARRERGIPEGDRP
jgi:iron complex transport system permease protein